jgi:hypothetical protein
MEAFLVVRVGGFSDGLVSGGWREKSLGGQSSRTV